MYDEKTSKLIATLKSLLIFTLAGLAVFQTTQLWFVNITGPNFFLYVQARFAPGAPDGQSDFARPFRIIHSTGDGRFHIQYSNIETDSTKIMQILSGGHFTERLAIDPEQILQNPIIIYEYAFLMNPDIFARAFGQRNGAALTNHGISGFYQLAITENYAFFIDDGYAWQFALPHPGIIEPQIPQSGVFFTPVYGNRVTFLPQISENFSYNPITVTNPHQNAFGGLSFASIHPLIESFFSNPATINAAVGADGIYTFSNINTMVRYLIYDVIEYRSFRSIGTANRPSFINDFSAALDFVTNDPNVINETFLKGYETRGREHVFFFNYVVNNFPLILQNWYTGPACQDPLTAPIEVTVDNGRVVRYRRLAHNFHLSEETVIPQQPPQTLGFKITQNPTLHLGG